jgi:hypothetical protein
MGYISVFIQKRVFKGKLSVLKKQSALCHNRYFHNHVQSRYKEQSFFHSILKLMVLLLVIPAVGQYQDLCFRVMYLIEVIQSSGTSFGWKRKSGYN